MLSKRRFAIKILFETSLILHYSQCLNQNLKCPDKWTSCENVCFFSSTTKESWGHAAAECKVMSNNSRLLMIDSKEKDESIRRCLLRRPLSEVAEEFWIDGTFNNLKKHWVFAAGAITSPLQYQAFSRRSAQDDSQFKCIVMNKEVLFRWSSRDCYLEKAYICENY